MDNSKDYPVMLYLNGLDSHAIAYDEEAAAELKAKGYVTHAEALKIKPKQEADKTDDTADQLAEAYEHIERLEDAMEVKDKQILDLNGDLEDKDKSIAANHEHIDTLRAELAEAKDNTNDSQEVADLKAKLAIYEETKAVTGDGVTSYDQMTNTNLHKLLESRKAEYSKRGDKDALIKAAKDSE